MTVWTTVKQAFAPALFALALPSLSLAQGASVNLGVEDHNNDAPIEITSETLDLNNEDGSAVFTGNVIVRQGDLTMTCERMVVEYAPDPETGEDEIDIIYMYGGVTMTSPEDAAESDDAIYVLETEMLTMFGNVLVTQGSTTLASDKLTYDLETGDGLLEGNVKTILN